MTETPDAAVQIVRKMIGPVPYRGTDAAVVDALREADMLCPPGTLAEIERLRAAANQPTAAPPQGEDVSEWLNRRRAEWPAHSPQWHFIGALLDAAAAGSAAPASLTGNSARPGSDTPGTRPEPPEPR